jgi:hypothetical protein
MTEGEILELRRMLDELDGLMKAVLKLAFGPSGEKGPVVSLVASTTNIGDPRIVDKFVMAMDVATDEVFRQLDAEQSTARGPTIVFRSEGDPVAAALRQPGALMSRTDAALLASVNGNADSDRGAVARFVALAIEEG